mgnify:CR=1 FL=1
MRGIRVATFVAVGKAVHDIPVANVGDASDATEEAGKHAEAVRDTVDAERAGVEEVCTDQTVDDVVPPHRANGPWG